MMLALRSAARVADRATQVARIGHLDERHAAVLLVIGTEPAVVGTRPADRRVAAQRHLRRLEIHLPALTVVVDVVGDEYALVAVRRTMFEKEDRAVFEEYLA